MSIYFASIFKNPGHFTFFALPVKYYNRIPQNIYQFGYTEKIPNVYYLLDHLSMMVIWSSYFTFYVDITIEYKIGKNVAHTITIWIRI